MRAPRALLLVFSLCVVVPAGVRAQSGVAQPDTSMLGAFTLGAGDVVQVKIWREPDLSGTFEVDESGRLNLPLLGTLQAQGRPWRALRDSLLDVYSLQLKNPSIVLTPLRRVQVLGEVRAPGQYLADPTMSVAGLVAQAGGANPEGDLRRVRVVRNGKTIIPSESVEALVLGSGVHSNDQIFVGERPWIERNGAFLASAIISTTSILITLIR